ncbi:hypothetical protein [Microvirga arvi]|uniref:hypothetical protein n=1 Tax=Microvirga arvi TaxID=2778731 RepID=UPI00194EAC5E|nr:hypothetical protein [Microvirga arvi]
MRLWSKRSIPSGPILLASAALFAHVPAETLLADVQIVMEPKPSDSPDDAKGPLAQLQASYGPYIAAQFDLAGETQHWKLHRRRLPSPPLTVLQRDGRS